ncbi:MAG: glycoside hydrolase family 97 protein [Prevotella sp.]|nr:glycoside hydrolase family 97 protein [Prevotella sp.]
MKKLTMIAVLLLSMVAGQVYAADYTLKSPNGKLSVSIQTGEKLTWAINHEGTDVLLPSAIAADCKVAGRDLRMGANIKKAKAMRGETRQQWHTDFYRKKTVDDNYNYMLLRMNGYSVEFRAYDEGAAYRFVVTQSKPLIVESEKSTFCFADNYKTTLGYATDTEANDKFRTSYESYYEEHLLSELNDDLNAVVPVVVWLPKGKKALIMDAGIDNYPSMFIRKADGNALEAAFDRVPAEEKVAGRNLLIAKREDFIARYDAVEKQQELPWRVVVVSEKDEDLVDTDMAMNLAPKCKVSDTSWIKPGKVAWDWYNDNNIYGVDFQSGLNTETYKYYIDFASKNNIEYIIIDEGWSGRESMTKDLNKNIDVPELVRYGRERGVGIILWALWRNIIQDMDGNMAYYEQMGVKGFKVDFFDRGDQVTFRSSKELAACAAKHHMLLDYHGHRAFGLNRTYPNIVNFEGVKGLENTKWMDKIDDKPEYDQVRYDVLIVSMRMQTGPMDYTPGAMKNATQSSFYADFHSPMSIGTRVHQMAMYTLYEAPLQMLADNPSNYMREQECTDFIARIPTTWDETIVLGAEFGEYVAVARKKTGKWYIAALNNWTPRDITIDLAPLGIASATADIFADGANAHRTANDYKHTTKNISAGEKLNIHLAPGGGWTAVIE